MTRFLILFVTLFFSVTLAISLVLALPGHYHLDETKLSENTHALNWTQSWDHPEQSIFRLIVETWSYSFSLQLLSFLSILIFSFIFSLSSLKWPQFSFGIEKILAIGISAPALFWIPLLIYFFCLKWQVFPLRFEPNLKGWILPLVSLSLRPLCLSTHILLSEWRKSEKQSYFLVARSKGFSRIQAFYRHGLKNALIPYSVQMGNFLVQSLIGSVLIETLFAFPGMGLLFVQSLQNRDLPLVLVLTILFTFIMMLIYGLVELLQTYLEPRYQRAGY